MGWGSALGFDNWETLDWGGQPDRAGILVRGQGPEVRMGEVSWGEIKLVHVKGNVRRCGWGVEALESQGGDVVVHGH